MDKMFKTFTSEIKGIDEHEMTLTAYVSTGARDRSDEVLEPGGADMRGFKANPVVMFAHRYDQPPIGKALWIKKDGDGILAKIKFASTDFAKEIFGLFKEGFMKAFSVGFIPKEWEDGDGQKKARRTFTKWELLEFSAVPVPANPEALMLAVQRGLLLSDTLKKEFKLETPPDPVEAGTTPEPEGELDPAIEPEPTPEAEPKNFMDELNAMQSEIAQMKEKEQADLSRIAELEEEVKSLKYEIYSLKHKPAPKAEISGTDIARLIGESVSREINRVRGRVS